MKWFCPLKVSLLKHKEELPLLLKVLTWLWSAGNFVCRFTKRNIWNE